MSWISSECDKLFADDASTSTRSTSYEPREYTCPTRPSRSNACKIAETEPNVFDSFALNSDRVIIDCCKMTMNRRYFAELSLQYDYVRNSQFDAEGERYEAYLSWHICYELLFENSVPYAEYNIFWQFLAERSLL